MVNKIKVLSLVLVFAMVFTSFTLPTNAIVKGSITLEQESTAISKKEVVSLARKVMETDNYVEGELLVVIKKEYSSKQAEFKASDFPEVNAAKVENLTYCSNPDSELISDNFRTILSVTLKHKTNEDMLQAIDILMNRKDVESVSLNKKGRFQSIQTVPPSDSQYDSQWALKNIDAVGAWSKTTGSSEVRVGIIDTGIDYMHEELASSMWKNPGEIPDDGIDNDGNGFVDDVYGWNFVKNNNDVMDTFGHGTTVAGVVAADINHKDVTGIAPNVKLVALDVGRYVYQDGTTRAIMYAANMGIDVLNFSSFHVVRDYETEAALNNYNGIFVMSAGNNSKNNDNSDRDVFPKTKYSNNVIKVASISSNDSLSSFSNYGVEDVALAAPGENVLSTKLNSTYASDSGTSLSSPYVAGVVALIKSEYPNLSNIQIISAVKLGVDKLDSLNGKVETGGKLNANKAMEAARLINAGSAGRYCMDVYNYADLKEALENDLYNGINILSDIELQGEIRITKSKTFYGGAKLKGNGRRHFIIDTTNGVTLDLGGVIYENGGIENRSSNFNLKGSGAVIINSNWTYGGALYNIGSMTVSGVRIENCRATLGGGVYNTGTINLVDMTIFNNYATAGGALYNTGTMTVSGGIFKNNTAQGSGGAIYVSADSQIVVKNSPQITYNTALYLGGGIYTGGIFKTVTPDGLKVAYNNAANGGGIYGAAGADISLTGVSPGGPSISISNNTASADGGGVYLDTGAHLYLHNAFITVNTAGGTGGGMLSKGIYTQGGFVQFIGNSPN